MSVHGDADSVVDLGAFSRNRSISRWGVDSHFAANGYLLQELF